LASVTDKAHIVFDERAKSIGNDKLSKTNRLSTMARLMRQK
jgi:hypothetical protein